MGEQRARSLSVYTSAKRQADAGRSLTVRRRMAARGLDAADNTFETLKDPLWQLPPHQQIGGLSRCCGAQSPDPRAQIEPGRLFTLLPRPGRLPARLLGAGSAKS